MPLHSNACDYPSRIVLQLWFVLPVLNERRIEFRPTKLRGFRLVHSLPPCSSHVATASLKRHQASRNMESAKRSSTPKEMATSPEVLA